MNDRPDWLPEPPTKPRRPLSERFHVAATSIVSLTLLIVGLGLVAYGVNAVATIDGGRFVDKVRVLGRFVFPGVTMLAIAYLMHWSLRRVRQEIDREKKSLRNSQQI